MKTLRDSKETFDEDSKNLIASYLPSGDGSITDVGVTETLKHSLSRLTINSPGLSKEQVCVGDLLCLIR